MQCRSFDKGVEKTILETVNIRHSSSITDNFVGILMSVIYLHFPQSSLFGGRWAEPGDVETLARVAETVVSVICVCDTRLSSPDPCSRVY